MDKIIEAVKIWGQGSLLLVGDGPLRGELVKLGNKLLGSGRFHWCTAKNEEMPALYRSADLLVSASISESFGLVYLEAQACGLGVVTQDDAIRREVVGEGGVFCNADDPDILAARIGEAVINHDTAGARKRALECDVSETVAHYKDMFLAVMEKSRA